MESGLRTPRALLISLSVNFLGTGSSKPHLGTAGQKSGSWEHAVEQAGAVMSSFGRSLEGILNE